MNEQEKKFKDGFNSGYLLAQHEPELLAKIFETNRGAILHNDYISGLSTGHDTYVVEKIIEQNKQGVNNPGKIKDATPEKKNPEKDYLKGFNSGYLLSKHEPQLAKKLITPQKNPTDYHKGLAAGKHEHEMEKTKARLIGISKNNTPAKTIAKNKGREK